MAIKRFPVTHVPIKDKRMIRDMNSKAVLNTDLDALKDFKDKKRLMEENLSTQERLNKIENDMELIKSLLTQLVNK